MTQLWVHPNAKSGIKDEILLLFQIIRLVWDKMGSSVFQKRVFQDFYNSLRFREARAFGDKAGA
jgi:hypothetical protein